MKLATSRLTAIAALAVAPILAISGAAVAATTITFQCRASAAGQTADFSLNQDVTPSAPATVAAGGSLAVVVDPAPNTVPAEAGGYTVRNVQSLVLKMPVPANSTYVSATLAGGSGLNSTPTIALEGSDVVLKVPGPVNGGANFELPTVTLNLTAGGSGAIDSKLGGTSYDDPGLTFTANVDGPLGIPISAPAKCYPNPNPTLTSTTIG
ncbi:cyclase [Fodinicola acaciae]|uniref:cyclase n=1 Tax=Fodinicola acaciae TaxID=2681555 RepID=UPI0013D8130B|nr:cyclase [Fodinicola acaciae]